MGGACSALVPLLLSQYLYLSNLFYCILYRVLEGWVNLWPINFTNWLLPYDFEANKNWLHLIQSLDSFFQFSTYVCVYSTNDNEQNAIDKFGDTFKKKEILFKESLSVNL